jgi:hypothetical protein
VAQSYAEVKKNARAESAAISNANVSSSRNLKEHTRCTRQHDHQSDNQGLGDRCDALRRRRHLLCRPAQGGVRVEPDPPLFAIGRPGKATVSTILRGVPRPRRAGRWSRGSILCQTTGRLNPHRATTIFPGRGRRVSHRQWRRGHAGLEGHAERRADLGCDQLHPVAASIGGTHLHLRQSLHSRGDCARP